MKNWSRALAGLGLSLLLVSCSPLALKDVHFGWPVESVLTVNEQNRIEDRRYSIVADLTPLAAEEFEDSTALRGKEIRLLRGDTGYYFLTGKSFRHVYVFSPDEGELALRTKIVVSERGLISPAMNQRPPYVELLDGSETRMRLTPTGVAEEGDSQ